MQNARATLHSNLLNNFTAAVSMGDMQEHNKQIANTALEAYAACIAHVQCPFDDGNNDDWYNQMGIVRAVLSVLANNSEDEKVQYARDTVFEDDDTALACDLLAEFILATILE